MLYALFLIAILSATPYVGSVGLPTITINAHIISGLDPGAVPGGSTTKRQSQGGLSLSDGAEIGSTDV